MINRTTFVKGYSRKANGSASVHAKSQSTEAPRSKKPAEKPKLPDVQINNFKASSTNTPKSKFSSISIIRPIEEKSKDYEKAIKDHLGIKSLSKDSSFSSDSPKIRNKNCKRSQRVQRSFDVSELASIEKEENRIAEAIKGVGKKVVRNVKKVEKDKAIDRINDKEMQEVQESLNKINLLLNRIMHKSPNKNK